MIGKCATWIIVVYKRSFLISSYSVLFTSLNMSSNNCGCNPTAFSGLDCIDEWEPPIVGIRGDGLS